VKFNGRQLERQYDDHVLYGLLLSSAHAATPANLCRAASDGLHITIGYCPWVLRLRRSESTPSPVDPAAGKPYATTFSVMSIFDMPVASCSFGASWMFPKRVVTVLSYSRLRVISAGLLTPALSVVPHRIAGSYADSNWN